MAEATKRRAPRRTDGEALEPLTVRLSARLKFGLELLARHQGRSLSAAIEWALQAALSQVKVGAESISLLGVASLTWDLKGYTRVRSLYDNDPSLVSFEERHACRLIDNSAETDCIAKAIISAADEEAQEAALVLAKKWGEIIDFHWIDFIADANTMQISSLVDSTNALLPIIGSNKTLELSDHDTVLQIEAEYDYLLELHMVNEITDTASPPQ